MDMQSSDPPRAPRSVESSEDHRHAREGRVPLVSVILPTHNYADYVGDAISSVLRQTVDDLELIVIDDGSTDRTPEVLAAIDDPRLQSVRTENRGASSARNEALERSIGRHVAFIDADDLWHPEKLERQLRLVSEPDVDFCFSDFVRFDDKGTFPKSQFAFVPELEALPRHRSSSGEGWVIEAEPFGALIGTRQLAPWLQTLVIDGEIAREVGFPDTSQEISEDLWYILLTLALSHRVAFTTEPLVAVRRHGANSYVDHLQKVRADLAVLRALKRFVDRNGNLDKTQRLALRRRIGRGWCSLGYAHFHAGRVLRAARAYARALSSPGWRSNAFRHLLALPVSPLVALLGRRENDSAFDDPDSRTAFPWSSDGVSRDARKSSAATTADD